MKYIIRRADERTPMQMGFEASVGRPLPLRIDNSFMKTYKPFMDDKPYRIFDTTKDYRRWSRECLPEWLGYGNGE